METNGDHGDVLFLGLALILIVLVFQACLSWQTVQLERPFQELNRDIMLLGNRFYAPVDGVSKSSQLYPIPL